MTVGAVCLLSSAALVAAPVYKVVDDSGRVTYTDNPSSYQHAGQSVSVTSINTVSDRQARAATTQTNTAARGQTDLPSAAIKTDAPVQTNYQLSILEPSTERAYQRPAQSVDIVLQVSPQLQNGDQVTIYVDGNARAQGLSMSIPTVDLTPGAHRIKAEVVTEKGDVRASVQRTVHVIQNTLILRQKKQAAEKLAAQLLAYERLPWHQKLLVRMQGSDAVNQ
ncbi:hypothetical protein GCM10009129_08680 [Psychrobacter aestuarii]|uniref:DUF4124 domain-containing protein n=2 Tax=Psychrobacter aestuarii TaxID=556327 RepID=A0ABN0VPS0_9GAMM